MLTPKDGLLGWATGRLIEHDARAPGAIRRLLSSSPGRRQAIFAFLAAELASERHDQTMRANDGDAAMRRSEIIRDGGARDVLVELLGREPPDGLRGALERLGLNPMPDARLYGRLVEIFTDPSEKIAAESLRYVGRIKPVMLRLINTLPASLLHPNVLTRLDSILEAHGLVEAVEFAQSVNSRASDAAILEAVSRMREGARLDEVIARFIRRADRPLGCPLPADDEVWPVASITHLIGTARQFRNCLGAERKIVGALLVRAAYAVLRGEAVMEFAALSNGSFLFVETHAARNGPVSPNLEALARSKCVAAGVPFVAVSTGGHGVFGQLVDPHDPVFFSLAA